MTIFYDLAEVDLVAGTVVEREYTPASPHRSGHPRGVNPALRDGKLIAVGYDVMDQGAEEFHEGQSHDEAQSGADRAGGVGVGVRGMGLGPGSENGRGRRSHRGSPEPDGAAAPGRAGDQEPPGARRVPHGAT